MSRTIPDDYFEMQDMARELGVPFSGIKAVDLRAALERAVAEGGVVQTVTPQPTLRERAEGSPAAAPAQEPHPADVAANAAPSAGGVRSPGRDGRRPLGNPGQKLAHEKRPGYVRRWINDVGTRLIDADQAGYTPVTEMADGRKVEIKRLVGSREGGAPQYAHLMEIREEFYNQDQADKMRAVDEVDAAIQGNQIPEGVQAERGKFYDPLTNPANAARFGTG